MRDEDKTKEQLLRELVAVRRRSEAARETDSFYERLVGEAGDAIIALDREGTLLTWNAGAERMFGWTAQEAVGASWLELQGPDEAGQIKETVGRVFAGETLSNIDMRRRRKDGTWLNALLTASPVRDGQGKVIAAHGIIKDVTARKRAEEELRKHRDRLEELIQERTAELSRAVGELEGEIIQRKRAEEELVSLKELNENVVQSIQEGLVAVDRDCRITLWNRPIEEMLGCEGEEKNIIWPGVRRRSPGRGSRRGLPSAVVRVEGLF